MKKIKCALLIDDDSINNFINERLIKKLNIAEEVKVVLNGQEGLKYIQEICIPQHTCPELILLDINMPVMDGFEFLKEYKILDFSGKNSIIIIMLTTSTSPNDTERLNDSGASGYINKPLTENKLIELMQQFFSH
jgi:CheY-like chemotaxis protein